MIQPQSKNQPVGHVPLIFLLMSDAKGVLQYDFFEFFDDGLYLFSHLPFEFLECYLTQFFLYV